MKDKNKLIDKALNYIKVNQAITLIDEVIAKFSELSPQELNQDEIKQALKNNAIRMQSALKIKLFKSNTTQSLLELNKILNQEENNSKITDYINNLVERWQTNEH